MRSSSIIMRSSGTRRCSRMSIRTGRMTRSGFTYVCSAGLVFIFLVAVQRHLRDKGWFEASGKQRESISSRISISLRSRRLPMSCRFWASIAHSSARACARSSGSNGPVLRRWRGLHRRRRRSRPIISDSSSGRASMPGGRVGRCDLGARLLASDDAAEADDLATTLDLNNRERQAIEVFDRRNRAGHGGEPRATRT